jgi:hypothetical protein
VAGFFVLAGVGCLCEVPLLVCGLRALGGAAVLYVLTRLAGGAVLNVVVDAMVRNRDKGSQQ